MAEQLIEQTGFAGVRTPDNGSANATAKNLSFGRASKQFIHKRHVALQPTQQLRFRVRRDVFIRKIDVRFDMRERLHQVIAQLVDALR